MFFFLCFPAAQVVKVTKVENPASQDTLRLTAPPPKLRICVDLTAL